MIFFWQFNGFSRSFLGLFFTYIFWSLSKLKLNQKDPGKTWKTLLKTDIKTFNCQKSAGHRLSLLKAQKPWKSVKRTFKKRQRYIVCHRISASCTSFESESKSSIHQISYGVKTTISSWYILSSCPLHDHSKSITLRSVRQQQFQTLLHAGQEAFSRIGLDTGKYFLVFFVLGILQLSIIDPSPSTDQSTSLKSGSLFLVMVSVRQYKPNQTNQRVKPLFKLVFWLVLGGRGLLYDSSLAYVISSAEFHV